jgi:hypothetical protein
MNIFGYRWARRKKSICILVQAKEPVQILKFKISVGKPKGSPPPPEGLARTY